MIAWARELRAAWPQLCMLAVLALLPVGRLAELPLCIGALAGVVLAWRDPGLWHRRSGLRMGLVVFACYWLAALCSAPDAVAPGKTWSTVAGLLRFAPFVLFAAARLRDAGAWPRLIAAIAAVVVLWLLDAWVQVLTGYSLGGAMSVERLTGIFGAGNLKLGPVLAVLSPFVFVAARARLGWRGLLLAFVFQLVPILLAGSRAAWLMYALVCLVMVWRETRAPLRFVAWSAAALLLVAVAAAVAWHDSGAFDARVRRSLLVFQGTEQAIDTASAGRLRIWGAALRMAAAHPLNGVGVRGFRYAYPDYARHGDAFVNPRTDEGAFHAHQILLEIASETGAIGLALWIAGFALAVRGWRRADSARRERALAPALALFAMTFPLNTHLAFYSAWWGLLFWWLLALYCAALDTEHEHAA